MTADVVSQPAMHPAQSYSVERLQPGEKRIRDHYVKYPFPSNVNSNYTKDFKKHNDYHKLDKKGGFNLEKEHKVINPHNMDLQTVQKDKFRGFKVEGKQVKKAERPKAHVSFAKGSIYKVRNFI